MMQKVVIQCAASKNPDAGFWKHEGKNVKFVAQPNQCSRSNSFLYYRPDDSIPGANKTWRQKLEEYNQEYKQTGRNSFNLCEAYKLYKNPVYSELVERLQKENVFILSAGWGLIKSDFLLPYYDITFSSSADVCKRRKKSDEYRDFNQLVDEKLEEDDFIYFFGGQDYLPLYYCLTQNLLCKKVIYHRSTRIRICQAEGYEYIQYRREGIAIEKWHYKCAEDFMEGKLQE